MKTKNNVQKAALKSMAVCIGLIIISVTTGAQNFWKTTMENNGVNETALAMVDRNVETRSASTDANAFLSFLEMESEDILELENWMLNENNFSTVIRIEEEIENPLELEDWMTNDSWFTAYSMYLKAEQEEALELENWMTDDSKFDIPTIQIIKETENELEIEDWMLNEDLFNSRVEKEQAMELEEWMTSDKIWII